MHVDIATRDDLPPLGLAGPVEQPARTRLGALARLSERIVESEVQLF